MTTVSTSTVERSVAVAMQQFGELLAAALGDATAIFRTIYGVADGNDYGRYFAGQNPLVPFIAAATSVAAMIAEGVTQRQAAATAVAAAVDAATGDQVAFAQAVFDAVETVRKACADPADAVRITSALTAFAVEIMGGADAIGAQIESLAENAAVLMRRAAAASLTRASADYVPSSQQDAAVIRDQIADALDTIATEAADRFEDNSFQVLRGFRVAVVQDLNARGGELAPVVTRTFQARQPAVVLAYRLYQNADRAGELLARNDPPHPAFMPPVVEALAA